MNYTLRMYRRLARFLPHEFKMAYGREVLETGEEVVADLAQRPGAGGLIRLLADIALRVPLEYGNEMRRDMRYALRGMIKSPGFLLAGIVSMGLGIGLTTVVYSSEWKELSRELPAAANAKRLVMPEQPVSYYYVERYREQKNLFTGVAAFQNGIPFNLALHADANAKPQRIFGQLVSADYFSVLGVGAQRGRVFDSRLDQPGGQAVVVITDRFWRNRLNAAPDVIGQTLALNGQEATIIGITPKDFNGALSIKPAELFVPITAPAALAPELTHDVLHQHEARDFMALMCLAPGVTLESAEAALDAIARQLEQQESGELARRDKGRRVTLLAAGTMVAMPRNLRTLATGFFALLMGLIMTIACMNLASMLLARGANRRKELAIRLAVGASRYRLVRQLLSEGILLACLGGVAGFALAYWLSVLNSRFVRPTAIPEEANFTPDWHAAIFAFVLAVVCGIAFSLIPALRATKADVSVVLKGGASLALPGYRRLGLRNLLMVAQVAGSLMLLLITGFLVLGITKATAVETRFEPSSMNLLSLDPVRDGYTPEKAQALFERLPDQIQRSPGVLNVAMAAQAPFSIQGESMSLRVDDSSGASPVEKRVVQAVVGRGYFAVLSQPMLGGREFEERDLGSRTDGSETVPVVLNESAARAFFGSGDSLGKHLRSSRLSYEVVGVVGNIKNGLGGALPIVYSPLTGRDFTRPPADGITIMVRSVPGTDVLPAIRRQIAVLDPKLNFFNVRTLTEYLDLSRADEKITIDTYGGIGLFGLILAAIGLAGVTAYAVAQRRKEIGIRLALGASKWRVLALVLREGTTLVTAGTILGFLGAYAMAKMLSALTNIFVESLNLGSSDPRLLFGAPLLLAVLALMACYLPARKAVKIDPLRALREE